VVSGHSPWRIRAANDAPISRSPRSWATDKNSNLN